MRNFRRQYASKPPHGENRPSASQIIRKMKAAVGFGSFRDDPGKAGLKVTG